MVAKFQHVTGYNDTCNDLEPTYVSEYIDCGINYHCMICIVLAAFQFRLMHRASMQVGHGIGKAHAGSDGVPGGHTCIQQVYAYV